MLTFFAVGSAILNLVLLVRLFIAVRRLATRLLKTSQLLLDTNQRLRDIQAKVEISR